MLLIWHGHACFEIRLKDGYTIALDPHDGVSIGLKAPTFKADLILVSHGHFDHDAVHVVKKPESIVLKSFIGEKKIDNIIVKGIPSYHDAHGGALRGKNTIYVIEAEGLRIAHLGDLGHILDEGTVSQLKPLDLLLTPVGGTFTIGPREAWELTKLIAPKITIPMHYKVPKLNLPLAPVDDFLRYVQYSVRRVDSNQVKIEKDKIPRESEVWILKPP